MFVGMLLAYLLAFFILLAVAARPERKKKYYLGAKILNSAMFVVLFLISCYCKGKVHTFWLMLPGIWCCFVGDVLMALYHRQRKRSYFLGGIGIFLAGHLCFVRWLCQSCPLRLSDLCLPAAAVFAAVYLVSRREIHTGRVKPFIIIYAFFVAFFLSKGLQLAWRMPSVAHGMIAAGSVLFFISDVSIVFLYFRKQKGAVLHMFNLATYYGAMFLLTTQPLFAAV